MLQPLISFLDLLKALRWEVKKLQTNTVARIALRKKAEDLSQRWLQELSPRLAESGVASVDLITPYDKCFQRLLKLSAPNNRKDSYLACLGFVTKNFRENFVLPFQGKPLASGPTARVTDIFKGLPQTEESYLKEALGCARKGFLRAAIVLGWCATIDRIHRKIDQIGFTTFNATSARMASQQKGRFKKFNKVQNIGSLSELREVFDNDVLWIIEGMALIDSNQHTRLRSCFDMRCQSAHPGDAPITEFNLLSFFSDIKEIVLANSKF